MKVNIPKMIQYITYLSKSLYSDRNSMTLICLEQRTEIGTSSLKSIQSKFLKYNGT